MRLFCLPILAALAALLCPPHGSTAWAADAPSHQKSSARCGSSADDAIAIAEKALASQSADNQAHALACVIAVVKALQAARLDGGSDDAHGRVLMVPRLEARKPQ
jgi:hypothetical protein